MAPWKYSFLLLLFFTLGNFANLHGQNMLTVNPEEYPGTLNNPFKGIRNEKGRVGKYLYDALTRTCIKWNEFERNKEDAIERVLECCNQKGAELLIKMPK